MRLHPSPGVPALASDRRRSLTSLAVALPGSGAALAGYALVFPVRFTPNTLTLTAFVFWILYSAVWMLLTHRVFAGADHTALRAWLRATTTRSGRLPTVNVQGSILATAAVGLYLVLPGLISSPLAGGLTVVVVLSAWLVTVSAYAVHYARLDSDEVSFELPGQSAGPVFADYYYLSAQIATTFSSSDINVLTTRARATLTGQAYVGFAFTTFIIALLISLLFL